MSTISKDPEALVRTGRKKAVQKRKGSLVEPNEEAQVQRKPLRRGKKLVFSKDTVHAR